MILSGIEIGGRPDGHKNIMGNNQQPWFTIEAIEFLEKNLGKNQVGFEFGSGSSTFWFSKLTDRIYSVESDRSWYNLVTSKIDEFFLKNIELECVECDMLPIWDGDTEKEESHYEYAGKILEYDFDFDYVSVDGVARSLCIINAIKKIKPGGFLIIDNAERPAYHDSFSSIKEEWVSHIFQNEVDTTLILQRPHL
jgi:hypothetical protein